MSSLLCPLPCPGVLRPIDPLDRESEYRSPLQGIMKLGLIIQVKFWYLGWSSNLDPILNICKI